MKHLKSLENIFTTSGMENYKEKEDNHKFIGDYVIANSSSVHEFTREFMQNNVGEIIQYWKPNNRFRVKYLNAPVAAELNADFSWWFEADEIIYHSKDKQECLDKIDVIKNTNKYNI